jgi:GTP-binding protein Era
MSDMNKNQDRYRCGFVTIIGCPNAGKSTIINKVMRKKISITSRKPQTTQKQILAVKTTDSYQIVFTDTPGLHQGLELHQKNSLNKYMGRSAVQALTDVDLILFIVAGTKWTNDDDYVLEQIKKSTVPCVLVINKIDMVADKTKLLPFVDSISKKHNFKDILYISALKDESLEKFETEIIKYLPVVASQQEFAFDIEYQTDQSKKQQAAEIIREKVIRLFDKEIPYEIAIELETFDFDKTKSGADILKISAVIWVLRKGQKIIIIGKEGEGIKRIGENARKDLERIFDIKVHLSLWVKVKSNWSNDDQILKSLGFDA